MEAVFAAVRQRWGRLDILVHSIAFCPAEDLHGRVTDCSRAGFAQAMDISVHSLIRMARLAEPLMTKGGTILTMTYYGGEKVVDHYNIMGPVKAALEGTDARPRGRTRAEADPRQRHLSGASADPRRVRHRAFRRTDRRRPRCARRNRRSSPSQDVGEVAVMLASDGARSVSGDVAYVDGGLHVRA